MPSRSLSSRVSAVLAPSWIVWPFLVAAGLLWLPFGFQLTGLIEEWEILGVFVKEGAHFVISPHRILAAQILRPLTFAPMALGYVLDPDSFFYWHVLLIAGLVVKGASLAWLLWFSLRSRRAAVFGGLLFLLFPADTMQLCFRSLPLNWALALILLGSACQVAAYEGPRPRRLALSLLAAAAAMTAILIYEVSLFLWPMPFLIFFARLGAKEAWNLVRREWATTTAWVAALAACVAYITSIEAHFTTYQNDVTGGPSHILANLYAMSPRFLTIVLPRVFVGGWYDAARIFAQEYAHYGYLVAMTALLLAAAWLAGGPKAAPEPALSNEHPPLGRLALVGLAAVVLGFCPYLLSESYISCTQRTYLYAAAGGAMTLLALSLWIVRRHRVVGLLWAALLLLLASAFQLYQFHHYVALSNRQKDILRSIDEGTPVLGPETPFLINDASARFSQIWLLGQEGVLSYTLTYFFNQPAPTPEIIVQPGNLWLSSDSLGRPGSLAETPDAWILSGAKPLPLPGGGHSVSPADRTIPKSKGFLLNIARDGSVPPVAWAGQSDPHRLARYRNILQAPKWPLDFGLFPIAPSDRLHFSFGNWWSMDVPPHGAGWGAIEWNARTLRMKPFDNGWRGLSAFAQALFRQQSMAWKLSPVATLCFELRPSSADYVLDMHAGLAPSSEVAQNFQMAINHHPLAFSWTQPDMLHADVPRSVLEPGQNEIEFISPQAESYYGLSLNLQNFDLKPRKPEKSP